MNIQIPSLILLNAPQGSGKSHLIRYMMYQCRKRFDYGICFSNTFFEDDSFDYIKKKYIHPEYNPDVLSALMKIQSNLIEEGKAVKEAFCIFDDCIDASQFKCPKLKQLCTQLRHYHITVIFTTQYTNLLPTFMRANAMAVIIFRTDSECNLRALYESYGQLFNNYNEFKNYLMQKLGNYKFVYYDKRHVNEDIEDTYRIMLAPERIPKFQLQTRKIISE